MAANYGLNQGNIREFVTGENGFGIDPNVNTNWYDDPIRIIQMAWEFPWY